jgi:hypothetical protein
MANTLAGYDALGRLGRAEKQRRGVECVRARNSDWVSTSNSNACRFRSTVCETLCYMGTADCLLCGGSFVGGLVSTFTFLPPSGSFRSGLSNTPWLTVRLRTLV